MQKIYSSKIPTKFRKTNYGKGETCSLRPSSRDGHDESLGMKKLCFSAFSLVEENHLNLFKSLKGSTGEKGLLSLNCII